MTIEEIEKLTLSDVLAMDNERIEYKDFSVFFVDLGDYFGYSRLVFMGENYVTNANDYALHHCSKSIPELREYYEKKLKTLLFADSDFALPLESYLDYKNRLNYLVNLYPKAYGPSDLSYSSHQSNDGRTFTDEERLKLCFDRLCFSFTSDRDFIERHYALYNMLQSRVAEVGDNFDYWKSAFLYEMFNYECPINWEGDWPVLCCFADMSKYTVHDYEEMSLNDFLAKIGFSPVKIAAYREAKRECYESYDW